MPESQTPPQGVSPERLGQMAWGYAVPLIVEAALETNLFDALSKGEKTAEQLSLKSNSRWNLPSGVRSRSATSSSTKRSPWRSVASALMAPKRAWSSACTGSREG